MSAEGRQARDASWRARHGADVESALARGDSTAIKRLYVELGDHLEESFADDIDGVPQLSLPETVSVVTALLTGTTGRILDAGCGPFPAASIASALADSDRTIVSLDLGAGTVRLARARAKQMGVAVVAVVGDVEALPFRTAAFAGVICDDTIEHVPHAERGAGELMRVVSPRGCVVLATPNRHSLAVLIDKLKDTARGRRRPARAYYVADSHLREYTWRELVAIVEPVATIDRRATVGWPGRIRTRMLSRIIAWPGLRHFDRMLVVRLRPRT